MHETEEFRHRFQAAFGEHRKRTGETLRSFSDRIFGTEKAYKWLRKISSEGSPSKREGTKNHDELKRLHEALGLRMGELWYDLPPDPAAVERQLLRDEDAANAIAVAITFLLNVDWAHVKESVAQHGDGPLIERVKRHLRSIQAEDFAS